MKTMKTMKSIICAVILFGMPAVVSSQSIVDTKHNLSVSGPGAVKASTEHEICLFCHTPHNCVPSSPLWNRANSGATYTTYSSTTMNASPGQPTGSSIMCLSCHDGTVALGQLKSMGATLITFASTTFMPAGITGNLGTDLRNDHPISFVYDNALAASDGELKEPGSILIPSIKLENNQLQCTSCHDAHNSVYGDFLVASTENSALCVACHDKPSWALSIHNTSTKEWNGTAPDPWPTTDSVTMKTVAKNACENCHKPHNSATGAKRLLKYATEENVCFDCHNGNVAAKNIQADFGKTYRHDVLGTSGVHEPYPYELAKTPLVQHVECADCHNSHAVKAQVTVAPFVKGSNRGVVGIDQSDAVVNPAVYEYQICYRCHSSSAVTASASVKQITQNNVRLEFAPTNPSFHPVVDARNKGVLGLDPAFVPSLSLTSKIFCTDCHASSGGNLGAHGSDYPQILKYNYSRTSAYDGTLNSYQLCYQCHLEATTISFHNKLDDSGTKTHGTETSCNTCHDPHGSQTTGSLINFTLSIAGTPLVEANSLSNAVWWNSTGAGTGTCNLKCHSHDHINATY